jgi:hypothetical protein
MRTPFDRAHATFWSSDRGLALLLLLLSALTFVVLPLVAGGLIGRWAVLLVDAWFALTLVSGGVALGLGRSRWTGMVAAVVVVIAVRWIARGTGNAGLQALDAGLSVAAVGALAAMILAQVFRPGPMTWHRVLGAVATYLLIGMVWSLVYRLVLVLDPNALHGTSPLGEHTLHPDLVYFSFVTLTTTGYGDILPVSLAARSLANVEGMIGQLFPAVLIAGLISMVRPSRRQD